MTTTKHNVNFNGINIVPSDNIFFSKSIKLLTIAISGSLLYNTKYKQLMFEF